MSEPHSSPTVPNQTYPSQLGTALEDLSGVDCGGIARSTASLPYIPPASRGESDAGVQRALDGGDLRLIAPDFGRHHLAGRDSMTYLYSIKRHHGTSATAHHINADGPKRIRTERSE